MRLFDRKLYRRPDKDGPDTLKIEGTPISANVLSIKQTRKGFAVKASPVSGAYVNSVFVAEVSHISPNVRVGSDVIVYVDEKDADGDYYMELGDV